MAVTDDVFYATISELSAGLKKKQFSAKELTRAYLDRLERLGPRYNALALLLRETAIQEAEDVDDDLKRDRTRGPLQGIPYGAKDLLAVKGKPTTWGAKPYAGQVFDADAFVINKLRSRRAILIGKLAMVELAGGGGYRFPSASLTGPGLNPWDRGKWSGGSSSGSGSAVAAGLVPFALGSETSGSILTPSAYCGVTGLRPTYGLVSRRGAMPLSWTLDKIGPMCRSAEDCGIVLEAIAGKDPEDPGSAGKSFYYAPQFPRDLKQYKMGWSPVDFEEWAEPAARPAFQQALEVIRTLGMTPVETTLPDYPYGPLVSTVIAAEAASIFEDLISSGKVNELEDQRQIAGLKAGMDVAAKDYLRTMRVRRLIQRDFRDLLAKAEVLVAPARYNPASGITQPLDRPYSDRTPPQKSGMSGLIAAGNLAGLPAISVPCGFAGTLPVALQIVGRPFSENLLLQIGREFQARTDWHRRRPPVS